MSTAGPPGELHTVGVQVRVDHYSAVHLAATHAREAGLRCGLEGSLPDQAAAVASELASNLDKYAVDGTVYLQPLPDGAGLDILAADRGPGMAELQRCLSDGYTTSGTLGSGLGAVRRVATEFRIRTSVPEGTVVSARIAAPGSTGGLPVGAGMLCLPADGEEECGDGCAVHEAADGTRTALVVDGLGHGRKAARAARSALRVFRDHHGEPLEEITRRLHTALRHTRGAAVGLLRLRPGQDAEYCGVGNVRLCVLSRGGPHRRVDGRPGVVGWNLPTPHTRTVPLEENQVAVVHSDGIEARWSHDPSPFLLRLPPELLPAALTSRHRRYRDDVTALALVGT